MDKEEGQGAELHKAKKLECVSVRLKEGGGIDISDEKIRYICRKVLG